MKNSRIFQILVKKTLFSGLFNSYELKTLRGEAS